MNYSDINDRDVFQIQPFAKRGNQPQNWTWILWWGSWSWWRSCLGGTSTMVVMWWRWKWYWWQRWCCLWLWWWCDGRDVEDNHSDDDDGRDDDWQSQVSAAPPVWAEKCTRPFAGTQWTTLRKLVPWKKMYFQRLTWKSDISEINFEIKRGLGVRSCSQTEGKANCLSM